jgi:hypothetical protein
LSFIDEKATMAALPRVVDLMADTLGWTPETAAKELHQAQDFYAHNGMAGLR